MHDNMSAIKHADNITGIYNLIYKYFLPSTNGYRVEKLPNIYCLNIHKALPL